MILANTIKQASQLLRNHNIDSCELDAQIILSNVMGVSKEFLITNDKINVSKKVRQQYFHAIKRRIKRATNNQTGGKSCIKKQIMSLG